MSVTIEKAGKKQVISGLQMEDGTPVNVIINASGLVEVAKWTLLKLSGGENNMASQGGNGRKKRKGGKFVPWTLEEDARLLMLRKEGKKWSEIAAEITTHSESGLNQRKLSAKRQAQVDAYIAEQAGKPAPTVAADTKKKKATTTKKRGTKKKAAAK